MEFLKKNYEKVVLVVVLLGLTIASCFLPMLINGKRNALEQKRVNTKPKLTPLPPPDMTMELATLQRAQANLMLDYTNKHNIFNPVVWKRYPDGRLLKENAAVEEGASLLQLTHTKELFLIVTYSSPSGSGYLISIDHQDTGRRQQSFVSKDSGEIFSLKGIKGPPEKPTELDLEWKENGKGFALTPDKSYRDIVAYSADLKYPPENKIWTDRKVNNRITFAGSNYKIVAITETNVLIWAESNDKKTTITLHPATEPR